MGKALFIPNTAPSYIAVSTDVSGSKLENASYIGAKVYMKDTGKTYIVQEDLTLQELSNSSPIGSAVISDMPIGGYTIEENLISGSTPSITDTTSTEVIGAQEGTIFINQITITNGNDNNGTFVNLTDGDGGKVIYTAFAAKGGGGVAIQFPTPIKFTSGSGIYAICETDTVNVRASISGYLG